MPQVVFSPGNQQDNDLNKLAFQAMSENLAENVRYRRAQQQRKAATAQDMQDKMALGLIPKSEITVTDEGFEFDDDEAKTSYYDQLSKMFGQDDMSREGGTNTTSQLIDNQAQFQANIAKAEELNKGRLGNQLESTVLELAKQTEQLGANSPKPLTDSAVRQPINQEVDARTMALMGAKGARSLSGTAGVALDMANKLMAMRGQQTTPPVAPTTASTPTTTAPTTTPTNVAPSNLGKLSASAKIVDQIRTAVGEKASEKASSEFNYDAGGIDVSADVYAKATAQKQSARIDELKTSMKNLLGLSALENYNNQLLRTGDLNQTAPINNTFKTAFDQRAAELKRWEEAATADGISQQIQKVGSNQVKTTGAKYSGKVATAAAYGTTNNINLNDVKGGTASTGPISAGNAAASGNAVGELQGADGIKVGATFDIKNNEYQFKGSKIDGRDFARWQTTFSVKEKDLGNGYKRFADNNGNVITAKRLPDGSYTDVNGNMSNSTATTVFLGNLGAGKVGSAATNAYSSAQQAANVLATQRSNP